MADAIFETHPRPSLIIQIGEQQPISSAIVQCNISIDVRYKRCGRKSLVSYSHSTCLLQPSQLSTALAFKPTSFSFRLSRPTIQYSTLVPDAIRKIFTIPSLCLSTADRMLLYCPLGSKSLVLRVEMSALWPTRLLNVPRGGLVG